MFTIAHTADLHIGMKEQKFNEVKRVCLAFVREVKSRHPSLIILAGDTFDEMDGKIRLDSEPARFCIEFLEQLATVAPVIIVRGTPSHDRDTPYILRHIKTEQPVFVGSQIEMIGLYLGPDGHRFFAPLDTGDGQLLAALTLFPSPDKSHMVGYAGDSITASNLNAGEALHDAMVAIGGFNESLAERNVPRVLVAHGMITGSEFSSGTVAIGEDLEFTINDLNLTHTDYKAFGHIHKRQSFPGQIYYSGSLGRLNFGEQEEKSWNLVTFDGNTPLSVEQIPSPARSFAFFEKTIALDSGTTLDNVALQLTAFSATVKGADVRIRLTIAEEDRHHIDREKIRQQMIDAGANEVKIELSIIPKIRQRAEGISRLDTLVEKIKRWAETVEEDLPDRVLDIAATIEQRDVDELIRDAEHCSEDSLSVKAA